MALGVSCRIKHDHRDHERAFTRAEPDSVVE
jgi:hypothetical protein